MDVPFELVSVTETLAMALGLLVVNGMVRVNWLPYWLDDSF